jgi:hypothetical protein
LPLSSIHNKMRNWLLLTSKRARTVHPSQSLMQWADYISCISFILLSAKWIKNHTTEGWLTFAQSIGVFCIGVCLHHEKTIVTWYQVTSGQLQPAIHNLSRPFLFLKLCRMNFAQYQWELSYFMGIPELLYNGSWAMPQ